MRDRTIFYIIGAVVVVVLVASWSLSMQGQYVGELDFSQANELRFVSRDLREILNDTPEPMNMTRFDETKPYIDDTGYCQSKKDLESGRMPIGDLANPLIVRRGDDQFQSVQFCVYSTETYNRTMYIRASQLGWFSDETLLGEGLTVQIDKQSLLIPALVRPEQEQMPSLWVAYEKKINVYVKAHPNTEVGTHVFMVDFLEPKFDGTYEVIGYVVAVDIKV